MTEQLVRAVSVGGKPPDWRCVRHYVLRASSPPSLHSPVEPADAGDRCFAHITCTAPSRPTHGHSRHERAALPPRFGKAAQAPQRSVRRPPGAPVSPGAARGRRKATPDAEAQSTGTRAASRPSGQVENGRRPCRRHRRHGRIAERCGRPDGIGRAEPIGRAAAAGSGPAGRLRAHDRRMARRSGPEAEQCTGIRVGERCTDPQPVRAAEGCAARAHRCRAGDPQGRGLPGHRAAAHDGARDEGRAAPDGASGRSRRRSSAVQGRSRGPGVAQGHGAVQGQDPW